MPYPKNSTIFIIFARKKLKKMYTIDEDYFKQIEDRLTPLGMSGLYQDEDGNLVNDWYQFYDPRYCGDSCEDYCKRMAAKYGYREK